MGTFQEVQLVNYLTWKECRNEKYILIHGFWLINWLESQEFWGAGGYGQKTGDKEI